MYSRDRSCRIRAAHELVGKVQVRRINPAGGMKGAGWRAFPIMLGFIARLSLSLILETRHYDIVIISGMKTISDRRGPGLPLAAQKCVIRVESPFELVEPISAESLETMPGIWAGHERRAEAHATRRSTAGHCVIAISQDIADRLRTSIIRPTVSSRIPNAVDHVRNSHRRRGGEDAPCAIGSGTPPAEPSCCTSAGCPARKA